ncbi:von Willebrand factor type A domain-containing protein [Verrucomicrobia bacterium]|jgi:Mg-chelatase subunit ChlD|nr:von Willebrand factor type A domain-containing protein [Verrucomicrobiota bacterium]
MNHSTPPPDRESRLSAYLLGELSPNERTELEAEMKESTELQSLLIRLRKTIHLIGTATPFSDSQIDELPESLQFSTNRRDALLETLSGDVRPQLTPKSTHSIPWYLPIGIAAGLMLALSYIAMIGRPMSGAVGTAEATSTRLFSMDLADSDSTSRPRLLASRAELIRQEEATPLSLVAALPAIDDESTINKGIAIGSQLGLSPESLAAPRRAFSFYGNATSNGPPPERNRELARWGVPTDFKRQESESNFESKLSLEAETAPALSEESRSQVTTNVPRGITRQIAQSTGGRGSLPRQITSEVNLDLKQFGENLSLTTPLSDDAVKLNVPTSDSREVSLSTRLSPSVRGRRRNAPQSAIAGIAVNRFRSLGETDPQLAYDALVRSQPAIEHGLTPGGAGGGLGGGGFSDTKDPRKSKAGASKMYAIPTQGVDSFGIAANQPLVASDGLGTDMDRWESDLGTQHFGDLAAREIGQQERQSQVETHWSEDRSQDSKSMDGETIFPGIAGNQDNTGQESLLRESLKELTDQTAPEGIDAIVSFSRPEIARDYYSYSAPSETPTTMDLIEDFEIDKDAAALGFSPKPKEAEQLSRGESIAKNSKHFESDFALLPQLQVHSGNIVVDSSPSPSSREPELLGRLPTERKLAQLSELEPDSSFDNQLEGRSLQLSLAKQPILKAKSLSRRVSGKLSVAESQLKAEKPDRELREKIVLNKKRSLSFPLEQQTESQSTSTFSLNVSDVSFQLTAASLNKGILPAPESIRPEEFFNALTYRDTSNGSNAPVIVHTECAQHPYGFQQEILRIGVRTKSSGRLATTPLNLVVLLDNSGSMERPDRQAIVRRSLESLLSSLNDSDKVSMLTFARQPRLWADGISASEALESLDDLTRMIPEGGTNLETAIETAYETARKHYNSKGQNRVILLTDGAANLGNTDTESLRKQVTHQREQGIALDCFGIGWEGYDDHRLESLTRNGDGRYSFLNDLGQVETNFIQQLTGALNVAAKNVKVQISFNPQRVTSYRQIGYAKHQLKKEQFRDNRVDAAELASEESGTALYVLSLKANGSGPIGELAIRFQDPETKEYHELNWNLPFAGSAKNLEQTTPDTQLALIAALFAERLAGIPYSQAVSFQELEQLITKLETKRQLDPAVSKLKTMISQAQRLIGF